MRRLRFYPINFPINIFPHPKLLPSIPRDFLGGVRILTISKLPFSQPLDTLSIVLREGDFLLGLFFLLCSSLVPPNQTR